MFEIKGKYSTAKVFIDNIDEATYSQIQSLVNSKVSEDTKVAIMPDCHAGAGCVIGTTIKLKDKVCPNLVGVDLGCGMSVYELGNIDIDLPTLDEFIKKNIPAGHEVNSHFKGTKFMSDLLKDLVVNVDYDHALLSLGSLGGGNHFIEIDKDDEDNKYLVIHSGSRHMGLEIAKEYQKLAEKQIDLGKKNEIIKELKAAGRHRDIQEALSNIPTIQKGLEYLQGKEAENYYHDVAIAQKYASESRKVMLQAIVHFLGISFEEANFWETIHNYVDIENMILRKGSISAQRNERVLIPINMRDGSIIAVGKGNPDYNYSAPHGAGRLMSRGRAKEEIPMDLYEESMEGIYTSCICESTLDESPFAYKDIDTILQNIADTVEVEKIIKPIYNFKAC